MSDLMDKWVAAETARMRVRDEAHVRAELARLGVSEEDAPARVVLVHVTPLLTGPRAPPVVMLREDWERLHPPQPSSAQVIVDALIDDLTDRRGFRQLWDGLDEDIQAEIRASWLAIVEGS